MDGILKNEDIFKKWHLVIAVAGIAFGVAALAAKNIDGFFVSLGLTLYGAGELANHPLQTKIYKDNLGNITGQSTSYPRNNNFIGVVLSLLGIGLFFFGLWRLIFVYINP